MTKKALLFAPAAFDLAETTRMLEIAKGFQRHNEARDVFDCHFISYGGDFEHLIEEAGYPLQRLEPRLTPEKIEHIGKVDKAEKFAPAFAKEELVQRIESETTYLSELLPAAALTGSSVAIPVTCRRLKIPLVWVIQSTWLEGFFAHGAGMTDGIRFPPLKWVADKAILLFINFWIRYGFLNTLNQAAGQFGIEGCRSIFDYWRGDVTIVAEPAEFSGAALPPDHYYTGPLIARQDFPVPDEVRTIPHDLPLIYFAMGTSGTPEIMSKIIESFAGKPYRVIAPVRYQLDKVPRVRIPDNVIVTGWLPAQDVNKLADLSVIHGGIGTVMTAAYAGKPIVGVGMQPEQVANLQCLVRKGFAIRVGKSRDPSRQILKAIARLLHDREAQRKAEAFARIMEQWDGPRLAADLLFKQFGA
jgi:UDP:flavonoid glycosyltransferase YjiC (YdhE family)